MKLAIALFLFGSAAHATCAHLASVASQAGGQLAAATRNTQLEDCQENSSRAQRLIATVYGSPDCECISRNDLTYANHYSAKASQSKDVQQCHLDARYAHNATAALTADARGCGN